MEVEEAKEKEEVQVIQESEKIVQSEEEKITSPANVNTKWVPSPPPRKKARRKSVDSDDDDDFDVNNRTVTSPPFRPPVQNRRPHHGRRNPFKRPNLVLLRKTGQSYLQDDFCTDIGSKAVGKCRECRYIMHQSVRKQTSIFCRFYAFRKLKYSPSGLLKAAGFSDPFTDPGDEDMSLWLPSKKTMPATLDAEMARFLIAKVGDQFCELIHQEKQVGEFNISENKRRPAWKRLVQGIREMCDVCDTTLFNFHFACAKCGFGVCLACYKGRQNGSIKPTDTPGQARDGYQWVHCSVRQPHLMERLMLTQAIAGDALDQMAHLLHKVRAEQGIPQTCNCEYVKEYSGTPQITQPEKTIPWIPALPNLNPVVPVPMEQEVVNKIKKKPKRRDSSSEDENDEEASSLLEMLGPSRPRPSQKKTPCPEPASEKSEEVKISISTTNGNENGKEKGEEELKHFVRMPSSLSSHQHRYGNLLPVLATSYRVTSKLHPNVPHSWLCGGKLLRLLDPSNEGNYQLFQEVWKRGQPVIVSNVSAKLNPNLWSPDSFSQDFGEVKNDLINCMNGKLVTNQPMKKFWDGFEYMSKRLKDEKGDLMLLKLKDWPAGDDFAEMLPSRFKDLMAALPLKEYTHRTGRLNLAARLPFNFVKPDLGPKMYIAYGSGVHLEKGTTNLHLDISDAVNLMVHASVPLDSDNTEHNAAVLRAITESDCDVLTSNRVTDGGELPGALWHIYNARDADKIRDLVNKVALERGERLEQHNDPIHDQSCYLDRTLRKRLMEEYNVIGYPIVQCLGDAVFIPAGAPHQVRNLQNCIKIAEDFVSPENVSHCFHLTEEFRNLSETHTNREDKLQIKNIIYHAVKDGLSVLAKDLPEIPKIQNMPPPEPEIKTEPKPKQPKVEIDSEPEPESIEPESNEPESIEPESNEPESIEPESNEPESNEPESAEEILP